MNNYHFLSFSLNLSIIFRNETRKSANSRYPAGKRGQNYVYLNSKKPNGIFTLI